MFLGRRRSAIFAVRARLKEIDPNKKWKDKVTVVHAGKSSDEDVLDSSQHSTIELDESQWASVIASHTPGCRTPCPHCGSQVTTTPSSTSTLTNNATSDSQPRLAPFTVTAKLSLSGDAHLVRKAQNYERFEPALSQDWNGFFLVPPLRDPTPARVVVPRFYGSYRHQDLLESDGKTPGSYQSDILLLEECGEPISVRQLSADEKCVFFSFIPTKSSFLAQNSHSRQECASLLFRFHQAYWTHGSFFTRNILVRTTSSQDPEHAADQDAKFVRKRPHRTFRLIDFGRTLQYTERSLMQDISSSVSTDESILALTATQEERNALNELRVESGALLDVPEGWFMGYTGALLDGKMERLDKDTVA